MQLIDTVLYGFYFLAAKILPGRQQHAAIYGFVITCSIYVSIGLLLLEMAVFRFSPVNLGARVAVSAVLFLPMIVSMDRFADWKLQLSMESLESCSRYTESFSQRVALASLLLGAASLAAVLLLAARVIVSA